MADEAQDTDERLHDALRAGKRLRLALLRWCELHQWDAPGDIIQQARDALAAWDRVDTE